MNIMTFDTAFNKTYITLGSDQSILTSDIIESNSEKYHSVFLIPKIIEILKSNNLNPGNLSCFGINIGPGSFTGIRICTVIARTAAQQLNIPVVPVPSTEILAQINNFGKTLVLTDARKNKFYAALYENDKIIIPPMMINSEDAEKLIVKSNAVTVCDSSVQKYLKEINIESLNYESQNYPLGDFLYRLTYAKILNGGDFNWAKAKPLYIQPPSITKSSKAG